MILSALSHYWSDKIENPQFLTRLHSRTGVGGRYFVLPLEKYYDVNTWGQANNIWMDAALDLGEKAIGCALKRAGLDAKDIGQVFKDVRAKVMVIAFKSDWLYPAYQSREIVRACKLAGLETTYVEVNSTYGHDAFLLKVDEETLLIRHFLNSVANGNSKGRPLVNEARAQNNR